MVGRRQYSDADKAAALAALDANGGNVKKTAEEIGIARKTLEGWSKERGINADVADLRHENRLTLIELFQNELYEIFTELPTKRKDATYAQLATAAGIFNDKVQLLSGGATERHEVSVTDAKDRLAHLLNRRAAGNGSNSDPQPTDG